MMEQQQQLIEKAWANTLNFENTWGQQSMERKRKLAMDAMTAALQLRQSNGFGLWSPVCPYDLAERLGIEMRFVDLPSMEGMYCKNPNPIILVSALRPAGRQTFNCAHELGHHVFKHGTSVDEVIDPQSPKGKNSSEEFLANNFAGFLLMPKSAVSRAFTIRGWNPHSCTSLQLYTIAGLFGVGYNTLIYHMSNILKLLPQTHANTLAKVLPKNIRSTYLGSEADKDLIIVDSHWSDRSIDIQVGDYIHLPSNTSYEGVCVHLQEQDQKSSLFCGVAPGIGRLYQPDTGWSAFVRVSRRQYVGRNNFRHLEEADDE